MFKKLQKVMIISCAIGTLSLLCACGTTGDLNDAPPMWGKAKQEYKEKRANQAQMEKPSEETKSPKSN